MSGHGDVLMKNNIIELRTPRNPTRIKPKNYLKKKEKMYIKKVLKTEID